MRIMVHEKLGVSVLEPTGAIEPPNEVASATWKTKALPDVMLTMKLFVISFWS